MAKEEEVKEVSVPVPPPSVAPPLKAEAVPQAHQADSGARASDPRLPPQTHAPAPVPDFRQDMAPPMPPMPPMPAPPQPPQPSYNQKEDGYVPPTDDCIVDRIRPYEAYLSSYPTQIDSTPTIRPLRQFSSATRISGGSFEALSGRRSTLSLGRLGLVLAKEVQYIHVFDRRYAPPSPLARERGLC